VNSEQVHLESLAETGERLCRPDVSRELHSTTTVPEQRRVGTWQSLPVLSEGGEVPVDVWCVCVSRFPADRLNVFD